MKIFIYFISILISACTSLEHARDQSLPGQYYQIKAGDTLGSLSKKYHVATDDICEINGITNTRLLKIGQEIFIPFADPINAKVIKLAKTPVLNKNQIKTNTQAISQKNTAAIMSFPVKGGTISREFSRAKNNPYDGIAISAPRGTLVVAAQPGRVIFVGDDNTRYGLLIILEHEGGLITVYTHLEKAFVKDQQVIRSKENIGTVGSSGGVPFPHLHFQVRRDQRPQNPRNYLDSANS
jgi:murein DD-endopeptidase MepM/ murein hydrolase activator NlpD